MANPSIDPAPGVDPALAPAALTPAGRQRTSEILARFAAEHRLPRVSVGDLVHALGDRGFGLLVVVLALPNAIPGPAFPGFSTVIAVPLLILSLQIALGFGEPRLPRWLAARSVKSGSFRAFMRRALPLLRGIERPLRPRLLALTTWSGDRAVGSAMVVLTLVLALPVPFANVPPALALVVIALGILEHDGVAIIVGLAIGVLSFFWLALLLLAGAELFAALGLQLG